MAKVAGSDKADLLEPQMSDNHQIEWLRIEDPDPAPQSFAETPFEADDRTSGSVVQGRNRGGLRRPPGEGAVWTFDPTSDQLTCIFQAPNKAAGNSFDKVTMSPRGGVLL